MIRFFLLIVLLFLLFYKKNIKESFITCLPRYYNQTATITDNNDVNYFGIIRNSDNNNISVTPINSDDEPSILEKRNLKSINFNNCPDTKILLPNLKIDGEQITMPCDVSEEEYAKNHKVINNNWISDEYRRYDSYCKVKDNMTCNKELYDFNCDKKDNTLFKDIKENINFCSNYSTDNKNDIDYSKSCKEDETLWDRFMNDDDKNKCGCIEKIDFENKDLDEKKTMINEKIEQILRKNCYIYGDNCKGFSYHIFDLDNKIDRLIHNNEKIDYNAYYFKNCHLKHETKYDNDTDSTYIKKILDDDNSDICKAPESSDN